MPARTIAGWRPDRIGRAGIALVPEGRQCFPNLTVDEHLVAFFANRRGPTRTMDTGACLRSLPPCWSARKSGQSAFRRRAADVGHWRALVTNPRLLILDEATEGLAPLIRDEIWACLARLRGEGQSVLVIDKYVEKLIALADRHTIIERGQVVWQGGSGCAGCRPRHLAPLPGTLNARLPNRWR